MHQQLLVVMDQIYNISIIHPSFSLSEVYSSLVGRIRYNCSTKLVIVPEASNTGEKPSSKEQLNVSVAVPLYYMNLKTFTLIYLYSLIECSYKRIGGNV